MENIYFNSCCRGNLSTTRLHHHQFIIDGMMHYGYRIPLSITYQLPEYRGSQFYWQDLKKTTDLPGVTDILYHISCIKYTSAYDWIKFTIFSSNNRHWLHIGKIDIDETAATQLINFDTGSIVNKETTEKVSIYRLSDSCLNG